MARNRFESRCYVCGLMVAAGTGHFERHNGGWRTKHANIPGDGRITCKMELIESEAAPVELARAAE